MAPQRAAELMRAGKLHAYVGGAPAFAAAPADTHRHRGVAGRLRRSSGSTRIRPRPRMSLGLRRGRSHRTRHGGESGRQRAHRPSLSGDALSRRLPAPCRPAPRLRARDLLARRDARRRAASRCAARAPWRKASFARSGWPMAPDWDAAIEEVGAPRSRRRKHRGDERLARAALGADGLVSSLSPARGAIAEPRAKQSWRRARAAAGG